MIIIIMIMITMTTTTTTMVVVVVVVVVTIMKYALLWRLGGGSARFHRDCLFVLRDGVCAQAIDQA